MRPNRQEIAVDSFTFTEEIVNGKLLILCAVQGIMYL